MKRLLAQVREFHEAFGVPVLPTPQMPHEERRKLRYRILKEEFEEYVAAENDDDLAEVADALGDMAYIIAGTALEYGIPLDRVLDAIHASNMAKLGPDGKPLKREDGKVIKPDGWQAPDIAAVLSHEDEESFVEPRKKRLGHP
jgi:predicted HAD superfamily Cof-like phosphohydrolase